jgi:hypothetical protein
VAVPPDYAEEEPISDIWECRSIGETFAGAATCSALSRRSACNLASLKAAVRAKRSISDFAPSLMSGAYSRSAALRNTLKVSQPGPCCS